ncbi:dUTP diphosphatase [Bartonella sp. CB189]|uniref:dUTP diphosphatase n=1 Tax=Bartonella sp. CB189 TaxID=3112254 RepID=UPI002F9638C7
MCSAQTNSQLNSQEDSSSISSKQTTLFIERLEHGKGLELPSYATAGSSCLDLRAALNKEETIILSPGQRTLIPTGFVFHLLPGYEAQIRPRSGLAFKYGITCLNTPGTIDSDYRGEVKVLLINLGQEDFLIERGMRIAQTIIVPVIQVNICTIEPEENHNDHPSNNIKGRGTGGFGSTGIN